MSDPSNSPINVLVVGFGEVAQSLLDVLTTPHYKHRVHSFLLVPRILQLDQSAQERIEQYKAEQVVTLEGELSVATVEYCSDLFQQHKIDTIVSCVGNERVEVQHALIDAAKHGSVSHFVPFDFGVDFDAMDEEDELYNVVGVTRRAVHAAVKASGMDWTFIACGALAEHLFTSDDYGVDLPNGTVRVPAALDTRITYTALKDVGELTAMSLCDSSTRGKHLRIGRTTTLQHIVDTIKQHKRGVKEWTVEQLSEEQLRALTESEEKRMFPHWALSIVKGSKVTVWEEAQTWKNGEHNYTELDAVAAAVLPDKK